MNFCRLPPERLFAAWPTPGVLTRNCFTISSANSFDASFLIKPFFSSFILVAPDKRAFSHNDIPATAPCPKRSSGTRPIPIWRRFIGSIRPIAVPSSMIASAVSAKVSPVSTSISSRCPLPAIPAIPSTSPACTLRFTDVRLVPC